MRRLLRWTVLGVFLSCSTVAFAKAPSDIVRLKNGGMVRGTIIELVPDSFVVVELSTGETRRFEMGEVKYAGPEEEVKPAPTTEGSTEAGSEEAAEPEEEEAAEEEDVEEKPTPPKKKPKRIARRSALARVRQDMSPVMLRTEDDEDITFHLRTATARAAFSGVTFGKHGGYTVGVGTMDTFEPLCTAPCEAEIAAGMQYFALSRADGEAVPVDEAIRIDGKTTLRGEYESYLGLRVAGGVLAVGGLALLVAAYPLARNDCDIRESGCSSVHWPTFFWTFGFGTGSLLAGTVMFFKRDEAHVTSEVNEVRARFDRAVARGRTYGVSRRWAF